MTLTDDEMLRKVIEERDTFKLSLTRIRDDIRIVDAGNDTEIHAALLRALRVATKVLQENP